MPQRWIMLLVLFLVRLAMDYQFQSVASVSSHLVRDLGFTFLEIGTLIGFFLLPGIFIAIPSGILTRRVTNKNLLMIGAVTMMVGAWVYLFGTQESLRNREVLASRHGADMIVLPDDADRFAELLRRAREHRREQFRA